MKKHSALWLLAASLLSLSAAADDEKKEAGSPEEKKIKVPEIAALAKQFEEQAETKVQKTHRVSMEKLRKDYAAALERTLGTTKQERQAGRSHRAHRRESPD